MAQTVPSTDLSFTPGEIVRPARALWHYYLIVSALTGPGFFFAILPYWFRYITLRYRFDAGEDGGVWMAHGILFKKEINLTYRRIQDIHVTANIIERWMGLAKVSVQTASGSSTPEMTVEGIFHAEALRDFLYQHMRGAKGQPHESGDAPVQTGSTGDEALAILTEIRDAMRDLRDRAQGSTGGVR